MKQYNLFINDIPDTSGDFEIVEGDQKDMALVDVIANVVSITGFTDSKVLLIAGVTKDLTKQFHAGNIIKQIAAVVGGGSGGGRPDMAQAGGTQPEKLDEAIEKVYEVIAG